MTGFLHFNDLSVIDGIVNELSVVTFRAGFGATDERQKTFARTQGPRLISIGRVSTDALALVGIRLVNLPETCVHKNQNQSALLRAQSHTHTPVECQFESITNRLTCFITDAN